MAINNLIYLTGVSKNLRSKEKYNALKNKTLSDKEFEENLKQYEESSKNLEQDLAFVKEVVFPICFGVKKENPPRRKKEVVLTNAENQKKFREKMKAEGYRRVVTWTKKEKLDPAYKNIKIKNHESSFMICKKEPHLEVFLNKVLEIANEQAEQGYFPKEVCQSIANFFKELGIDN
jgi:hypothetical protein